MQITVGRRIPTVSFPALDKKFLDPAQMQGFETSSL